MVKELLREWQRAGACGLQHVYNMLTISFLLRLDEQGNGNIAKYSEAQPTTYVGVIHNATRAKEKRTSMTRASGVYREVALQRAFDCEKRD